MIITWLGHSCFKVEEKDFSVVIDPYADGMIPGLKNLREEANMVITSHEHDDHNARKNVAIKYYFEDEPIEFETISTFHDHHEGSKRGPNNITILRTKDSTIAHLGDLGCLLTPEQKEELRELDVLLIPIGGYYTIDSDEARALVDEIKPRIVVPMHYRDGGFGFDVISTKDRFIELSGSVLELDTSAIRSEEIFDTQVVFLKPKNYE